MTMVGDGMTVRVGRGWVGPGLSPIIIILALVQIFYTIAVSAKLRAGTGIKPVQAFIGNNCHIISC